MGTYVVTGKYNGGIGGSTQNDSGFEGWDDGYNNFREVIMHVDHHKCALGGVRFKIGGDIYLMEEP